MKRHWRRHFLTSKRVALLLLVGFAIGLLMISLGWADTTPQAAKKHHHKHKTHSHQTHHAHATSRTRSKKTHAVLAHHAKHKHPTQVVSQKIHNTPPVPIKEYNQPEGLYSLHYPADWRVAGDENAMVVRSAGPDTERGVFGVVRRPDSDPNDDALAREFHESNRPADLRQMQTQVDGLPATKVIGSNPQNPSNQMVEYYVQGLGGHQYYVLMMAPKDEWQRYSGSFDKMLNSLSLN